jgi:hypothetical protein
MCRRGVVMHVTTRRRHPGGHPPSSIQVPATHTNAPHCVRTGDRQRHVQAVLGRNTSSEARKQALGTLPMRSGSRHGEAQPCESANACIYNIRHTAPVDESLPLAETFCGKVYRATWAGVSASLGIVFLPSSAYHSCTLRGPGSRVTRAGEGHRGALPVPPGQAPGRWGAEGRGHPRQGKIHCRHGRVTTRAYNAKGAM